MLKLREAEIFCNNALLLVLTWSEPIPFTDGAASGAKPHAGFAGFTMGPRAAPNPTPASPGLRWGRERPQTPRRLRRVYDGAASGPKPHAGFAGFYDGAASGPKPHAGFAGFTLAHASPRMTALWARGWKPAGGVAR